MIDMAKAAKMVKKAEMAKMSKTAKTGPKKKQRQSTRLSQNKGLGRASRDFGFVFY